MFGWLDFKDLDAFADGLVADLVKRSPPAGMKMPAKQAAERLRRVQDVIFSRAEAFARDKKPGFYRKARLGNRVRWALREAGYTPEFADILSEELVAVITVASR
jgi:hypothetical protein